MEDFYKVDDFCVDQKFNFRKMAPSMGKTPTEVEATLNTIRIYPKNAAKIFRQNLYLQSSQF
jgi:hypothetical protein